jgi:hypothetical protein
VSQVGQARRARQRVRGSRAENVPDPQTA